MTVLPGLRPALRIARRDALQHRGRSGLIVALIALPVMVLMTLNVLLRSSTGTPGEQADMSLGQASQGAADAWIQAPAGAVRADQNSPSESYIQFYGPGSDPPGIDSSVQPLRPMRDVLSMLPHGAELTPWMTLDVPARGPDGHYFTAQAELVDLRSPVAAGRFRLLEGVAPTGPGQVALTAALAGRMRAAIGSSVMLGAPAGAFTVVGLLDSLVPSNKPGPRAVAVAMPGQIAHLATYESPRYLMRGAGLDWAAVQQLNGKGVAVYSRSAITAPGADSSNGDNRALLGAGITLGALMAVMQVVFLAGPAFAVGARRMRRQLGQLGAAGGSPAQIRSVVLAGGLVLGTAGSLVGVGLGLAIGVGSTGFVVDKIGMPYVAEHIVATDVGVIFGVGLLTALLAALVPAISASRTNLVAALARAPGTVTAARWWSVAGAITCAAGIGLTMTIAFSDVSVADREQPGAGRPLLIGGGLLLAEVGLLMATPLILQVVARLGRALPTTPRLALRDAARHRGRSGPAVAAVVTVTAAAVAVATLFATLAASQEYDYRAGLPVGSLSLTFDPPADGSDSTVDGSDAVAAGDKMVTATWPAAQSAPLGRLVGRGDEYSMDTLMPPANRCPWLTNSYSGAVDESVVERRLPNAAETGSAASDWRCAGADYSSVSDEQARTHPQPGSYNSLNPVLVGGPDLRRLITGIDDPQADQVLRTGGTVLLDRQYAAPDGTFQLSESHYDEQKERVVIDRTVSLPASPGRWSPTPFTAVISEDAARQAGLAWTIGGIVVDPHRPVDQAALDTIGEDLAAKGISAYPNLETGHYPFDSQPSPWLILGLAAVLIGLTIAVVTALSVADAREDLSTLGAVGAPGWMRRRFSGWSAFVVTGLGCVLGGLLGLVPSFGLTRLVYQSGGFARPFFEVPWLPIVTLVVGLPVLAFLVAAGVTRSKISAVGAAH